MSPSKKILVIGAGELGKEVLLSLARYPHPNSPKIAVLLRSSSLTSTDPKKIEELNILRNEKNIQIVSGDISNDSEEALATIFRAYDTIIGCTGFAAGAGTQLKLARAALIAEVPRYLPWQFGVDYDAIGWGSAQDLFDEQLDVRVLLRAQSKTKWAIISTGMFTSFLFEPWFGVVDFAQGRVSALGGWENRVTVTAPEDIGRVTAEAVLGAHSEEVFADRPIYVAGDTLSYAQLAELVEKVTGREFTKSVRTVEAARTDLKGDPSNSLLKYQVVFGEGKGVAWDLSKTWNRQIGMHLSTAEEWAKQHLARSV